MPDLIQWTLSTPLMLGSLLFGYLCGSIPFGLILTRMAGLGDVRKIGSGNIGATNVLRTGNKKLAAATLLADALKGTVAVVAARQVLGMEAALIAGLGAFLGHLYPVWLKFKGGKGVATALGAWLALSWPVGLIACAAWLLVAVVLRYSSVAALVAVAVAPLAAWKLNGPQLAELGAFMAVLVWVRHHENIARLLRGQESRIKLGRSKGGET